MLGLSSSFPRGSRILTAIRPYGICEPGVEATTDRSSFQAWINERDRESTEIDTKWDQVCRLSAIEDDDKMAPAKEPPQLDTPEDGGRTPNGTIEVETGREMGGPNAIVVLVDRTTDMGNPFIMRRHPARR